MTLYHVTKTSRISSIKLLGLLPSNEIRRATQWEDCEGNIYVCEFLGNPGDRDRKGSKSAHWWRGALAKNIKKPFSIG
jgi:hypothetical protein